MPDFMCGPIPYVVHFGVLLHGSLSSDPNQYVCYTAQEPKTWPSHGQISYSFVKYETGGGNAQLVKNDLPDSDDRVQLVKEAIDKYTKYANVSLDHAKDDPLAADVRIAFDAGSSWSTIGVDALRIPRDKPTMNLAFLSGSPNVRNNRDAFLKRTLHECGHIFGRTHEWDDTWETRGGDNWDMGNAAITQHMAILSFAESKGFRAVRTTSDFPKPDRDSIMAFLVPWINSSPETRKDAYLSDKDIAWLTLNYPGKVVDGGGEDSGILQSLNDLEVPIQYLAPILRGSTVSEIRFHYHEYISDEHKDPRGRFALSGALKSTWDDGKLKKLEPESHVLKGKISGTTPLTDHAREDDMYDSVAAAVLSPQFHQVISNAVNANSGHEQGSTPGANGLRSADVQSFPFLGLLGTLIPVLTQVFSGLPNGVASGIDPYGTSALPPYIEQGIFDAVLRVLQSDTAKNVLIGAVSGLLQGKKEE